MPLFPEIFSEHMKRHRPIIEPIQPDAFIASAALECMTDMRLAQLALEQETSDPVRQFAMRLIEDCERTLLEITRVATRKNLAMPGSLDEAHESVLQRMREKAGPDFDSAYIQRIALHHRHAINLFKRGQTIKVPEISALASRVLAMIEARIKTSRLPSGNVDQLLDGIGMARPQSAADLL